MPSEEKIKKTVKEAYYERHSKKYFVILGAILIAAVVIGGLLQKQPVVTTDENLKKFASYDELKNFITTNAQEFSGYYGGFASMETGQQTASTQKAADYSATNIQVAGVDEADIVKNDGKYIYVVSGTKVLIIDAYPAESAKILSEIELNATPQELFVNGDRLVVFGNDYQYYPYAVESVAPGMSIRESMIAKAPFYGYSSQSTYIKIYDISDRENPVLSKNLSADGYYFSSRMIGDYVYAVVNQPVYSYGDVIPLPAVRPMKAEAFPDIYYFDVPDRSYSFVNIIAINTQNDEEDPASKTYMLPSTQAMFVSTNNIYLTYMRWLDVSHFFDKIIDDAVLPATPSEVDSKITEIRNANMSRNEKMAKIGELIEDHMKSLGPEEAANFMKAVEERMIKVQNEIAQQQERTIIQKISIDGNEIKYEGHGDVPGRVLNQFSMDEYNNNFRIATTTTGGGGFGGGGFARPAVEVSAAVSGQVSGQVVAVEEPPEPRVSGPANNLYVLNSDLKIIGKVEGLAPGERIYSARFMGDRAYMVTFRQVDPLFVIDLKNPANPAVLGYLKVTGFSDYIHPVDENHIIGIGKEATEQGLFQGLKMSLFDVSDVTDPKEISKIVIGDRGTDSYVLRDHKAFLFNKEKRLLVLPVLLAEIDRDQYPPSQYPQLPSWAYGTPKWQGAYVFDFTTDNGFTLRGKIGHASGETQDYDTYYGQYSVKRSLYMDDVLYTISDRTIKMNDIASLDELNKIEMPGFGLQKVY